MKPWKVRKFAGDLVYDLRSRNLLPIALMLLAGMVAIPLLIARSGSGSNAPAPGLVSQSSAALAPENQAAVLASDPGVRNYKRRLRSMGLKDPFVQQFTNPTGGGSDATASTLDQTVGTLDGSTDTSTGDDGGSGGGVTKEPNEKKGKTKTQYVSYDTDVLVGESGQTLTRQNRLAQFAILPSQEKPVLVYLGTTSGGSQAIFLVSKDVTAVGGEGVCFPSPDACQLLGLNAGKGADLIYGPDGKTYHVQVAKIKRVVSSKAPG